MRAGGRPFVVSLVATWRDLLGRRSVVVLLLASFSFTMAIEVPFIVYGDWLETTFGLSLSALGLASTVVGVAEAAAELGTTVVTDRLGKRRSVLLGALGLAASLLALPWLARLGLKQCLYQRCRRAPRQVRQLPQRASRPLEEVRMT